MHSPGNILARERSFLPAWYAVKRDTTSGDGKYRSRPFRHGPEYKFRWRLIIFWFPETATLIF